MYFPKSQIKTNLYTNGGEFIIQNSSSPYVGYYYETSNGQYFSGRNPNESPTYKLTKIISSIPSLNSTENTTNNNFYLLEREYIKSTRLTFNQTAPSPPKQS